MDTIAFEVAPFPADRSDITEGAEVVSILLNGREFLEVLRDFEAGALSEGTDRVADSSSPLPATAVLPPSRHWLGEPVPRLAFGDWAAVYTCGCGAWECGCLLARISLKSDEVVWSDFATFAELDRLLNPDSPQAPTGRQIRDVLAHRRLGPFRFRLDQYERALHSAAGMRRSA